MVATSQIAISGAYGAFRYAQLGAVDLAVVAPLLAGSALGALLGAKATDVVDAEDVKGTFGLMLLAGAVAVGARQLASLTGAQVLDTVSLVLIFGSTVLVVGIIAYKVLQARKRVGEPAGQPDLVS